MKKVVASLVLVLSLSAFGEESLNSTRIKLWESPDVEALEKAKAYIDDAIQALQAGNKKKYYGSLKQARASASSQFVVKTYPAAFLTRYMDTPLNYFEEGASDSSIFYEVYVQDTCFNGSPKDAAALLNRLMEADYLNYDEVWYENARVSGLMILVDRVDGPNEATESHQILSCSAKGKK